MDESIRRRLCTDGEAKGVEARFNVIVKIFSRHLADPTSGDSGLKRRLEALLCQSEWSIQKSAMEYEMMNDELEMFDVLSKTIDDQIDDAMQKIEACKVELQEAKQIRKNKQEYNAVANVIMQNPERSETQDKLEELRKDIAKAEDKEKELQQKLELRRKEFHVLMVSLLHLNQLLEDDITLSSEVSKTDSQNTMDMEQS